MPFKLSRRSRANLIQVHPSLVRVVERAIGISSVDFSVVEGLRSLRKQKEYFRLGKSMTMKSKHLMQPDGFSHAVDLAPWVGGTILWSDGTHWHSLSQAVKEAARVEGVAITWGGDWQSFVDKPHWQLS